MKNINPFLKELPHNSKNNNLLLRLGNGYNPQSGYWDDAYSCQRILSLICAKKSTIEILEKYVGRITWRISKELN